MIKQFRGSYGFLSNFYLCDVFFNAMLYPSVEHAYQAQKSVDPNWKMYCQNKAVKPADVKKLSYKQDLIPGWDEKKLDIMKVCLVNKFCTNPLKTMLMDTGFQQLQEGNTWGDRYWGVDLDTGIGQNHLGKLLMEVRDELFKAEGRQ